MLRNLSENTIQDFRSITLPDLSNLSFYYIDLRKQLTILDTDKSLKISFKYAITNKLPEIEVVIKDNSIKEGKREVELDKVSSTITNQKTETLSGKRKKQDNPA